MGRRTVVSALAAAVVLGGCSAPDAPADRETSRSTAAERRAPGSSAPSSGAPAAPEVFERERHPAWRRLRLETGWGPGWRELDRATALVRALPLDRLAGQVVVARYGGTQPPVSLVRDLHLGGVVVFGDNVTDARALAASNRLLQERSGRPWPVWVSTDQEGGRVARVSDGVTPFPHAMALGAAADPALARSVGGVIGRDLGALGFNVDFAPVADVVAPQDVTIRARAFGDTPAAVAPLVLEAARGLWDGGVVPVVKHFPGHGSVPVDSHVALPRLTRPLGRLRAVDGAPFDELIRSGAPAVMVGHLVVPALDPGTPASLSRPVVTGELRRRRGFAGLVVSDALDMGAVVGGSWGADPAVRFLQAGGDVVLMPPDPAAARAAIIRAVDEGRLPRRRLEQAAARQVALLLARSGARPRRDLPPGPAIATRLAHRSVVVAAPSCGGRLVTGPVAPYGDPDAVAAFGAAADRAGLPLARRGTRLELVGWADEPDAAATRTRRPPDVLVSVADAAVLGRHRAVPVRVAAWGTTPATMDALVAVLRGEARARGALPVAVPGLEACSTQP